MARNACNKTKIEIKSIHSLVQKVVVRNWLKTKYCKNSKISDTWKFAVINLKVEQDGFSLE